MSVNWRSRIVGHGEEAPDQLLANPANWRIHPKAQQDALAGVLGEIGWVQSVIVNKRTGHLVDGHLRVSLALRDEASSIPVVYVDLSPEEEALVLATIDPLAAMAHTDKHALSELLSSTASSSEVVESLLRKMGKTLEPEIIDNSIAVPAKPIAKLGQIWEVGANRIACGDAFDSTLINSLLQGKTVGAILTDPPYGIDLDTDYNYIAGKTYRKVLNDDRPFDATDLRKRFHKVDEQFWFGANYYRRTLSGNDLDGSWLVWSKHETGSEVTTESLSKMTTAAFELIWSSKKHSQKVFRHFWTNFASARGNDGFERIHPTEKPIALLVEILDAWIKPSAVVFDPFAGSGTTLIAAVKTGRVGLGVELDPAYVDVIIQRLERATGQSARLVD